MTHQLNMTVIVGSTREGRLAPAIARWFVPVARSHGRFEVDVLDLAETDLPAVLAEDQGDVVRSYLGQLARGDVFVVITPEYNHGYPAPLKQAIDLAVEEWRGKPVAFVSYGGVSGGLRAVEQLRQVFSELHAVTIRDGVCIHHAWTTFGEGRIPDGIETAAKTMLDQLDWWGTALREARTARPYGA